MSRIPSPLLAGAILLLGIAGAMLFVAREDVTPLSDSANSDPSSDSSPPILVGVPPPEFPPNGAPPDRTRKTATPRRGSDRVRKVRVQVVDEATGEGITEARVTVGPTTWTESRDGAYDLDRQADGSALLVTGSAAGYFPSDPVLVEPGEAGPVRIALRRGSDLAGRVLLPDGTPLDAGAPLGLVVVWISGRGRTRVLARGLLDGSFRFDAVEPGRHTLHVGRLEGWGPVTIATEDVVAPTLDAAIRLTEKDLRVANALVVRVFDEAGEYEVSAGLRDVPDPHSSQASVIAAAGTQTVRLRLPVEPVLVVRLDERPLAGAPVIVFLLAADRVDRDVVLNGDGVARFPRCQAGVSYTVWVPPDARGRYVLGRDVRVPGEVRLSRVAGRRITVRVEGAGELQAFVHAEQGGLSVRGRELEDGTFDILGLPEGPWNVMASVYDKIHGPPRTVSAEVEAGGDVVLTIPSPAR